MNRYDAIIIGARCGGAPLAMLLARSGHKVLLMDKMAFGTDIMSTHYTVHLAMLQPLPDEVKAMLPQIVNSTDAISAFIGAFLGSVPLAQIFPPHLMERFAADVVRGHEENRDAA